MHGSEGVRSENVQLHYLLLPGRLALLVTQSGKNSASNAGLRTALHPTGLTCKLREVRSVALLTIGASGSRLGLPPCASKNPAGKNRCHSGNGEQGCYSKQVATPSPRVAHGATDLCGTSRTLRSTSLQAFPGRTYHVLTRWSVFQMGKTHTDSKMQPPLVGEQDQHPKVGSRSRRQAIARRTYRCVEGWLGAACDLGHLQGVGSKQESKQHINILEMMAVQLTVARWMTWLRGKTVLFKTDNLSVVYYITKQGGTRSPTLLHVVHDLLLLTEKENITLLASHVKGDLNVLADMLSRKDSILKHKLRLGDASFRWLRDHSPWGDPWCELFANKLNHHLARYVSPCPDSDALAVDALVCDWPKQTCYAFPPTALLDKVVTKIQQERPMGLLLVAPLWPHTTWFPILQAHSISTTRFPLDVLSLHQPHFDHRMPSPEQLCLALWCISFADQKPWATKTLSFSA